MKKRIVTGLLSLTLAASMLAGCGLGKGASGMTKIEGFDEVVTGIENIEIPEGVRIVALGEATHGNSEFQQLKREVFEILNEKHGIKALILEGDFGGCSLVNDYIQGGEGDTKELTHHLGYRLYRTPDMENLIKYMREYNDSAAEGDKIRFYGMDIQSSMDDKAVIENFYALADTDKMAKFTEDFESLIGTVEYEFDTNKTDDIKAFLEATGKDIEDNKDAYIAAAGADSYLRAKIAVTALKNYIELNSGADYNRFRDDCMRAIVKEVLEFEETEHNSELMLSCHNGHMTKNQSSRYTFLGKDLYDELGSAYYAIGTDFYVTNCNLPGNDGRVVKEFCSDDPLAYSMKDSEIKGGYLDFAKVEEGSNLYKYVYESIPTGSLGEYYQTGMELMKANYQLKFAPSEMYDAMILYYEVTPTEIWTD